jgi:basic membrane lipoprotein Med (substrate-binding protein (PBP1-ABC) superfamily)
VENSADYCLEDASNDACRSTHKVTLVVPAGVVTGSFEYVATQGATVACTAQTSCCIEIDSMVTPQADGTESACALEYAAVDSQLTIAIGEDQAEAMRLVSKLHLDKSFAIVDYLYDPVLPNVENLVFREDQSGYLAGFMAAKAMSSTAAGDGPMTAGVSAGPSSVSIKKYVNGFQNGLTDACADCSVTVLYAQNDDWSSGIQQTKALLQQGVRVVFAAGGDTATSSLLYAAAPAGVTIAAPGGEASVTKVEQAVFVIGAGTDAYVTTFENGARPGASVVLSSALKQVDIAVRTAIGNHLVGNAKGRTIVMDITNGGVRLAECHDACFESVGETAGSCNGCSAAQMNADDLAMDLATDPMHTGVDPWSGDQVTQQGGRRRAQAGICTAQAKAVEDPWCYSTDLVLGLDFADKCNNWEMQALFPSGTTADPSQFSGDATILGLYCPCRCAAAESPCNAVFCGNNGQCDDSTGSCVCSAGITGATCNREIPEISGLCFAKIARIADLGIYDNPCCESSCLNPIAEVLYACGDAQLDVIEELKAAAVASYASCAGAERVLPTRCSDGVNEAGLFVNNALYAADCGLYAPGQIELTAADGTIDHLDFAFRADVPGGICPPPVLADGNVGCDAAKRDHVSYCLPFTANPEYGLDFRQACASLDCVGGWSDYTACSTDCGGGVKQRMYSVTAEALSDGSACEVVDGAVATESCNEQACTSLEEDTATDGACANVYCGANGACVSGACVCLDGFFGAACQQTVDACAGVDCNAPFGMCDAGVCKCYRGYSGNSCRVAPSGCHLSERLMASGLTLVTDKTADYTLLTAQLQQSVLGEGNGWFDWTVPTELPDGYLPDAPVVDYIPQLEDVIAQRFGCIAVVTDSITSESTVCMDNANVLSGEACPPQEDYIDIVDYCATDSECASAHRVAVLSPETTLKAGTFGSLIIGAARSACAAQTQCCVEVDKPKVGYDQNYACELQAAAAAGADLTISAGVLQGEALGMVAAMHPTSVFAAIDFAYYPPVPNVESIIFREDQAGYLAGVIAAQAVSQVLGTVGRPESFKLGVCGVAPLRSVQQYVQGFTNGVKFQCQGCTVITTYGNGGVEQVQQLLAQGVKVIFGVATGDSTVVAGMTYAAAPLGSMVALPDGSAVRKTERAAYIVGAETDIYTSMFENGAVLGAEMVITSAVKRVDVAVKTAIANYLIENARGRNLVMDVVDGGVDYAECHRACQSAGGIISQDMMATAASIKKALGAGSLTTGVDNSVDGRWLEDSTGR